MTMEEEMTVSPSVGNFETEVLDSKVRGGNGAKVAAAVNGRTINRASRKTTKLSAKVVRAEPRES